MLGIESTHKQTSDCHVTYEATLSLAGLLDYTQLCYACTHSSINHVHLVLVTYHVDIDFAILLL